MKKIQKIQKSLWFLEINGKHVFVRDENGHAIILRDFPPRKYNIPLHLTGWHLITFPPPQRVYGGKYADVTTKISRMDSLPNFLSYAAPLVRASSSAINRCVFPSLLGVF